jgi:nicotinamide-nucleotide amidase
MKQVHCEIITIGDEILIGQIVDTNSAWMATELNKIGIRVKQISSISDDAEHIISALNLAANRADLILLTGGLGPTKDDLTKKTLASYFESPLVFNEEQYAYIERIFTAYGREVTPINRQQAEVPLCCTCLPNELGTAPGMWFEKNERVFVAMPGVPYEMKSLMQKEVLPRLIRHFKTPVILHRTFRTQGVGESMLASWIEHWEDQLPPHLKLAYLPSVGEVKLRISAWGDDREALEHEVSLQAQQLLQLIGKHIYAEGEDSLALTVHRALVSKGLTLSIAESCTGGAIAASLTQNAGASAYFIGGMVSYDNRIKSTFLDVPAAVLENQGAVSEETVQFMASGIRKKFSTDVSVAVSGVAGPSGGSDEKPVGLVWIAVDGAHGIRSKSFRFAKDRERNIEMTRLSALKMLLDYINSDD